MDTYHMVATNPDKWFLEIYTSRDDVGGFALLFQIGFVRFFYYNIKQINKPCIYNSKLLIHPILTQHYIIILSMLRLPLD